MKRSLLRFSALAIALSGCSRKSDIWLIEVDTTKGDGYSCAYEYNTNFSGSLAGNGNEGDGPVTETTERIGSKILFYAKLVDLSSGQSTLNSGSLLLPGENKDGKWTFAWTEAQSDSRTLQHEADYEYASTSTETNTTTVTLEFSGRSAKGTMTVESGASSELSESDTWGEEASQDLGTSGYLDWYTTDGWEYNGRETSECEGDDCSIKTASVCGATAPLTATLTDLSKREDFASLVSLQQVGSFKTTNSDTWGGGWDSGWDSGW
jgi:hypothetical protein